jgi:hypothetical protein
MSTSRKILFRFSTIRPPQRLSPRARSQGFISFDSNLVAGTHFFNQIDETLEATTYRATFSQRAESFQQRLSLATISERFSDLLHLFTEIRSERYHSSYEQLPQTISLDSIRALSKRDLALILDNLAYYLTQENTKGEVDSLSGILVANKFLDSLKNGQFNYDPFDPSKHQELRRIAYAKVILPTKVQASWTEDSTGSLTPDENELMSTLHDSLVVTAVRSDWQAIQGQWLSAIEEERRTMAEDDRRLPSDNINSLTTEIRSDENDAAISIDNTFRRIAASTREHLQRLPSDNSVASITQAVQDYITELESQETLIEDEEEAIAQVLGTTMVMRTSIPDGTLMVRAFEVSPNQYDYYLSYYTKEYSQVLTAVTGTYLTDTGSFPITASAYRTDKAGVQLFKLNEQPSNSQIATFEITLNTLERSDVTVLSPFRTFETLPHTEAMDWSPVDDLHIPGPPLYGIQYLGIADYRRVEQELACYTLGEVSHIENIYAREFKERTSRSLTAIQRETEFEEEQFSERRSDTESTDKSEMSSEATSALQEATAHTVNVNASFGYNGTRINANASAGYTFNTNTSKEESNSQALNFAKEVTQKIEERITQKRLTKRKSTFTQQFEQIDKHGFDNREGDEHVVAICRWVNKIFRNYIVNYGKRMTYEFIVPEPGKQFIRSQIHEAQQETFNAKKPISLRKRGIKEPKDINRNNYLKLASRYGVTVEAPPSSEINISRSFAERIEFVGEELGEGDSIDFANSYTPIEIPEGYWATHVSLVIDFLERNDSEQDPTFRIIVGDILPQLQWIGEKYHRFLSFNSPIKHSVPVSATSRELMAFSFSVTIHCKASRNLMPQWKLNTYNQLKAAYQEKLAIYQAKKEAFENENDSAPDLNPRMKQEFMKTELKRLCMEMMAAPFSINLSGNHYKKSSKNRFQEIRLRPKLDRHAQIVKFFNQAFEWELLSVEFYPYFHGPKKTWLEKMQMEATKQAVFESFLKSGMARVVISVTPGFEAAVSYFMQTGEVYLGNDVLVSSDDLYVSIVDELRDPDQEVEIEDTWTSLVPTNLTILQERSAALDAEGLPCDDLDEHNAIGAGTSMLNPILPITNASESTS